MQLLLKFSTLLILLCFFNSCNKETRVEQEFMACTYAAFDDNGKDILMPMVSVSIPIFNNAYKSKTKQNRLLQAEIQAQKQDKINTLKTVLDKAVKASNSAIIRYTTQSKNLEKANNAEEILIKNYETGTINFKDVLDIQELQLKFQMNQIASVTAYYIQTTVINYLTK